MTEECEATNPFYIRSAQNELRIDHKSILYGSLVWEDVVEKLISLHKSGQYRVAIHGKELDALQIAQRINRKEAFIVGFFAEGLLNLRVPSLELFLSGGRSSVVQAARIGDNDPHSTRKQYFSKSLEWSIHLCVLNHMFDENFAIRPEFCNNPHQLKQRFFWCGVAQLVLLPFLLLFMVFHFIMNNMYEIRRTSGTSKSYMGPRVWSNVAKWTFSEFNELPHMFARRLAPSYSHADSYLKLFGSNEIVAAISRVSAFVSGSLVAVLFLFAGIDESVLLHVKVANQNLLWWVGVLGLVFGASKSMLPDQALHSITKTVDLVQEAETALMKVAR